MEGVIHFYSPHGAYGYFSNFYPSPVTLKGKVWPTTEHYFQAMKYEGTPRASLILKASNPRKAATLGRCRTVPIREDWEAVKYGVMREAVLAKFTQHEDLKGYLLDTGDERLVEHTARDACWGDGGDGSGKNWLGMILMEVREEVRSSL
jgi:ribA/ribD-fused uncharacterized protein